MAQSVIEILLKRENVFQKIFYFIKKKNKKQNKINSLESHYYC